MLVLIISTLAHYKDDSNNDQNSFNSYSSDEVCNDLTQSVDGASEKSINGTWREFSDTCGKYSQFIPDNLEAAKSYIKGLMDSIQAPFHAVRSQTCHGCHRPLGDGAHQGSLTGKNRCTLPHYFLCKGGIEETASWKACPEDYVFNPNLLISGHGFESTLQQADFMSSAIVRSTPAGSSSSLNIVNGESQSDSYGGVIQKSNSGPPNMLNRTETSAAIHNVM